MPHEFSLGEIYLPPLLVVSFIAYLVTNLFTIILAKAGAYRFIALPAIFELSIFVLLTAMFGFYIPFL